jgi:hypothetical protein
LWWPVGSKDEVEREFLDQFIDKNAKTFKDLDIEPGDIANFTYKYLVSRDCITRVDSDSICANDFTARIQKLIILRSATNDREGEARGEEVLARFGQPIECCQRWLWASFTRHGSVAL